MKLLLDTHVWLWAFEGSERLGPRARARLMDQRSERWISAVSTLEIARLVSSGRLVLRCPFHEWMARSINDMKLSSLGISHAVAAEAYFLPGDFHPDPADRQLAATARIHGLALLTADERILAYPHVATMDARV